ANGASTRVWTTTSPNPSAAKRSTTHSTAGSPPRPHPPPTSQAPILRPRPRPSLTSNASRSFANSTRAPATLAPPSSANTEPTTRLVLKAVVQQLGHECLIASDGDRAWELLQATPIDVLITDWMMPGLDGPELCRRVRARPTDQYPYTYIVMATVMSERADV